MCGLCRSQCEGERGAREIWRRRAKKVGRGDKGGGGTLGQADRQSTTRGNTQEGKAEWRWDNGKDVGVAPRHLYGLRENLDCKNGGD